MFQFWHVLKFQPANSKQMIRCYTVSMPACGSHSAEFSLSIQSFNWCFHLCQRLLKFYITWKCAAKTLTSCRLWQTRSSEKKANLTYKISNLFIKLSKKRMKKKFCNNLFISKLIAKPFCSIIIIHRFQCIEHRHQASYILKREKKRVFLDPKLNNRSHKKGNRVYMWHQAKSKKKRTTK